MPISFASSKTLLQMDEVIRRHWPEAHDAFTPVNIVTGGNADGVREIGLIAWNLTRAFGAETLTIHTEEPIISIEPNGLTIANIGWLTLRYTGRDTEFIKPLQLRELLDIDLLDYAMAHVLKEISTRIPAPA